MELGLVQVRQELKKGIRNLHDGVWDEIQTIPKSIKKEFKAKLDQVTDKLLKI